MSRATVAAEAGLAPAEVDRRTVSDPRDELQRSIGQAVALPQIPDPGYDREGEFEVFRETFLCMVTDPEVNRTLRVLGKLLFDGALASRGSWPNHPGSMPYWDARAVLGDMRFLQYQLQRVGREPWDSMLTPDEVLVCTGAGAEAKAVARIASRLESLLASHEHLGTARRQSPEELDLDEPPAASGVAPGRQEEPVWDIRRAGRAWHGLEARQRCDLLPQKLEVFRGRLLWDDEERRTLLGLLLENLGADEAVRLGSPEIWRAAVAQLPAGGA